LLIITITIRSISHIIGLILELTHWPLYSFPVIPLADAKPAYSMLNAASVCLLQYTGMLVCWLTATYGGHR